MLSAPRGHRPTVLFVTGHLPYPPVSGGRRREWELLTRLSRAFRFHLLVSSKTFEEDMANADRLRTVCASVHVSRAGTAREQPDVAHWPELMRTMWSPELAAAAERILATEPVDVVHVERFHLLPHVPTSSSVPIVLVEQNIEYALWRQRLARAHGRRERRRFFREYVTTLKAEIDAWRRAAVCGAVTEEDRATMLAAVPDLDVRIVAHGIEAMQAAPSLPPPADEGDVLVFVANFAYAPNADAALHLCREVLPQVLAERPSARLLLVGNDPPPEVLALRSPHVVVTGRVPEVERYFDRADVVVCPLREGGGIKVKLLEAMARGRPVVTTSVGAQGFGERAWQAMRVADTPHAFARAILGLLGDPAERRRLGEASRKIVEGLPTWDDAARSLAGAYRDVIRARAPAVQSGRR